MNRKLFQVVGLMLAATVVAAAEMRTWTFEKSGKTMQGEVVSFDGNSVLLKVPEGKTLSVALSYLIESDRDYLSAKRKQSDEEAAARARDRMSWSYERRLIKGTVLQKIPEGLLVSSGAERLDEVGIITHHTFANGDSSTGRFPYAPEGDKPGDLCLGVVLLVDYSNYPDVVDGDKIEVMGHHVGTHTYTTSQGSMKTVRRFTVSISNFEQRMAKQEPERKQIDEVKSTSDSYKYEGHSHAITGKVLQKLPNGLLVSSGVYALSSSKEVSRGGAIWSDQSAYQGKPGAIYVGLVLLVDFSKYSDVVDDDFIQVLAYPVGEYSYTAAQGARKTVRKFSAKPR